MKPTVQTSAGRLVGEEVSGVAVFRGIPYARPPLGALRWRPPEPARAWSGSRDATRFGPAPPQVSDALDQFLGIVPPEGTSEDCLTLNVWTPGADAGRRPVLVWIPGGGFRSGHAAAPLYSGRALAARGDCVVVGMNYRVGALGFLRVAPGEGGANFGLLDQLAALRWVRDEIEAFGGDPGNVTVFGESAGAGSLASLLASPASAGLLRRAIVQSAAPNGVISAAEADARTGLFAAKLGAAPTPGGLADVPAEKLLEAQEQCAAARIWATGMFSPPVVDGALLPERPLDAIRAGSARAVDVLVGTTRDEMKLFAGGPLDPANEDMALAMLTAQMPGPEAGRRPAAERVFAITRAARRERGDDASAAEVYFAAQSDLYLRVPATRLAARQAAQRRATFAYLFTWESPWEDGIHGACHAADLPFALGNLDAPNMDVFAGRGPAAERLKGDVMDAWLAFARSGNPAHEGIGDWPAYTEETRHTMLLGARCGAVEAPLEAERAAWDAIE